MKENRERRKKYFCFEKEIKNIPPLRAGGRNALSRIPHTSRRPGRGGGERGVALLKRAGSHQHAPPACPDRLRTDRCYSDSTTPRSRGGSSLPGAPPLLRERGGSRTTRRRRRCRFGGGALGPRVVPYKVQPASVAITLQSVVEAPPVCPAAGPRRGGILETWDHEPVAAHGKVETCSMCEWTHPSCGGLGNGLGIARDSRKG